MHSIEINGSRIVRYRILAPAEWNFHPRGAHGCALEAARGMPASEAETAVGWIVAALDPCIACHVPAREAAHA